MSLMLSICNQFSVMSLEDDFASGTEWNVVELILILYLHDRTLQGIYFLFSKLRCMSHHTQTLGGGETRCRPAVLPHVAQMSTLLLNSGSVTGPDPGPRRRGKIYHGGGGERRRGGGLRGCES